MKKLVSILSATLGALLLFCSATAQAGIPGGEQGLKITLLNAKNGDILLARGPLVSGIYPPWALGSGDYTHAGLFDKARFDAGDTNCVLTANANGVGYESIAHWANDEDKVDVYRVTGASDAQAQGAINFARSIIGKPYNITSTLNDNGSYYCSKVVNRAWVSQGFVFHGTDIVGINLTDKSATLHYCTPNDLSISASVMPVKPGYVGFFQDADYKGYAVWLAPGSYTTAQLVASGIKNNDITAIKVPSGFTVALYDGDAFSGQSAILTNDSNNLYWNPSDNSRSYFNDVTSSVRIFATTVYQDADYAGYAVPLPVGTYTLSRLQFLGIKDNDLTSVKVAPGYQVSLYDNDNFLGGAVTLTSDWNNLYWSPFDGSRCFFNDATSSLTVSKK